MRKKSPHPKLDALARRLPYQNHWGQRLLSLSESSTLGMRGLSVAVPLAPPLFFGLSAALAILASQAPWGWAMAIPLLVLSFWCARATAYSWVSGPLQSDQVAQLQEWLGASVALTQAASGWSKPGEQWRQRDYRLVRAAYLEEYTRRHGKEPDLPTPNGLGRVPWLLECLLPTPLGGPLPSKDIEQWLADGATWLGHAKQSIPADPGGYTPAERRRVERCVARYRKLRAKPAKGADHVTIVAALDGSGKAGYFSEGTSWLASVLGGPAVAGFRIALPVATMVGILGLALFVLSPLGSPVRSWSADYAIYLLSELGRWCVWNLGWVTLLPALVVFVHRIRLMRPRLPLAHSWAHTPLSPLGKTALENLVQSSPRVAAWFLPAAGEDLRQLDLRFARQLWKLTESVEEREEEMKDKKAVDEGAEQLPATQAYIARQRSKELDSLLPPAQPSVIRGRF